MRLLKLFLFLCLIFKQTHSANLNVIRDAETEEVVVPFDTLYTKLSADSNGMYFDLWMEGLQPERFYKIMFRSDNDEGVQIFDEDYFFKVIR